MDTSKIKTRKNRAKPKTGRDSTQRYSREKKQSLTNPVVEQFDSEWMARPDPELTWYINLLSADVQIHEKEADDQKQCDCLESDHGDHI